MQLKLLEKRLKGKYRFSRKQKYLAIRPDCYRMLGLSVSYQGNSPPPVFFLFPAARINVQSICLK